MLKRFLAVFFLIGAIIVGVFVVNLLLFVRTPSGETTQELVIERGMPLGKVLETLEEKEIISNRPFFKIYIVLKNAAGKIRAGEYSFPPQIRPREVLELLLKGDFATSRVMIPEGWTTQDIASLLGQLQLANPDLFLAKCADPGLILSLGFDAPHLEGYLFPDTYEIYKPKNEEEIIQKFVGRFKEVFSPELEARAQALGLSRHQVMTFASMVERETATPSERPLIAAVFLNRFKNGMPLASDPTVIYGLSDFAGNLTKEHLNRPGPYNTYLNLGLPPTPIANPGLESIRAVLYPAQTDYLYFVSKNDGTHHFSRTEAEHQEAVRRYQIQRLPQSAETRPKRRG